MYSEQESLWLATLTAAERCNVRQVPQPDPWPTCDLLVLGGGIVSLATAYYAAERGLRVQIITDSVLARDAEFSLGCIDPNVCRWQFAPATQQLAQASRDWWAKLAVRPEFQIDWRVCGALMVDAQRLAPAPRQHMLAALDEGYSVHDVDAEQVALLEPAFSPHSLGGLHYPSEAVLHPLRAASGFLTGCTRRGGLVTQVDSVSAAHVESGRVTRVETSAGVIQPQALFCDDLSLLARLFGDQAVLSPSIETSRQIFIASEPTAPVLKRPVLEAHWTVQLKSGEIVIAAPLDQLDQEEHKLAQQAVARTRQLIPALGDVNFNRLWSGTSSRSPRATPVIDQPGHLENVWASGGLDFAEILFAPIIGKLLVDWMQKQARPEELVACQAAE